MRGKIAIFIDGNNLFHAARSVGVEIDYAKFLNFLRNDSPLLRAFFYTGVDEKAERQQGFLLWMRRNGYRVVEKELKTYADGTKKANLDVEIAVDMLSLADKYDTAVLVSGDEDFAYAINAVAYKGVRVELAGFRSNTSPRLIDVADQFIELDSHLESICKSESRYNHYHNNHHSHVQTRNSGSLNTSSLNTGSLNTGNLNNNHLNGSAPVTGNLNPNNLPSGGFVRVQDEERAQPASAPTPEASD
ncbi:MAG TPA: NYN domain-containing protein [Blastocatellia bacterium]|nr:NYN domain-containing protein [Blastocatellia bacterium]